MRWTTKTYPKIENCRNQAKRVLVGNEVVGPAGPTTATRMDKFTDMMLERTGLIGMVGKAERGPVAIEAIRKHGAVYLMAVGGAAYLVSKAVRAARVVAFEETRDGSHPRVRGRGYAGHCGHHTGPAHWRQKIGKIPVVAG